MTTGQRTDVFVSYSPADERWAAWIAWELEDAGYRTMMQAWDFVPGTNFIDFMDRGVSEAQVVVAVLSSNYLRSRYGRMEWQAAIRASPDDPSAKLITVRLEDCELEGLLSTITYVDLVGVPDEETARDLLLTRVRQAVEGRAKPAERPPGPFAPVPAEPLPAEGARPARRAPSAQPGFPSGAADAAAGPDRVTVLHLAGPRFGRTLAAEPFDAAELQERVAADLAELHAKPDLVVVTGDLTESGSRRECAEAAAFLTGLRAQLGLEPHRIIVVPGVRDVTKAASRSYFELCDADDVEPQPPYWPKWRHFAGLFAELYRGLDGTVFDSAQPWTLFTVPELRLAVAGLNSTMAVSHRAGEDHGQVGHAQAAWFAGRLRGLGEDWLRVGVVAHSPETDSPGRLRDADLLGRIVVPSLDLVLHGGTGAAADLPSGAAVFPSPAPGRLQVLTVDHTGVTVARLGAEPVRVERPGLLRRRPPPPAVPAPRPAADDPPGPAEVLLDQITEACETRFPGARVRRVAADPPHLLVTRMEDGFVRQFRIGAHPGTVGEAEIAEFLRHVHAGGDAHGSELVHLGEPPSRELREDALRRGVRLRSLTEFQGLLDLSAYVAGQTARLEADPLYPPGMYVPQRFRELDGGDSTAVREGLVAEMLRMLGADHGRFLLLLGDFGRGKTFSLREVARRIPRELPSLIPILIELRALDKAQSVEALVAAHLAAHGEELIDLRAFRYMLRQGRIVLLFDGFDELVTRVTYDRAADHLETLLAAAEGEAKIVVASRTQHFKSHAQVFTALGERVGTVPNRRVWGVEPFTPAQIRAYLGNRYRDEGAADRRMALLRGVEELLGLAQNPRMLGFIADLPEERLRLVAQARRTVSAAHLYQEILTSWLAHEERRMRGIPGSPDGLSLADLWLAAGTLALRLWETGESHLRLDELGEVAETLSGLAETDMSPGQTTHAVGAGGLLVRSDDGMFGFIHGSVPEWLVARRIADDLAAGADPAPLGRRALSQLSVDFLCDLADPEACRRWTAEVLADPSAGDVQRANAVKISTRLRTPPRTDLRGANLQGEDLSYRNLSEVDLTGADLTDAHLVGADLTRAVLRGASLAGARLDEARLTGADLTGADLSRARLVGTDLRDAVVTGGTWTRAALIATRGGAAERVGPRGAAVVPGDPVDAQFAPAAMGIPFGFHFQNSRIPAPVSYSPDGSTVAFGAEDGSVLLCDSRTGLPLRTLRGHHDRAYAVVHAGDDLLVTGAADGTLRIWDAATGRAHGPGERRVIEVHPDGVWPVVADGTRLAAGAADGVVRLWDLTVEDGPYLSLPGHDAPVYTCAFSPDGAWIVTGDSRGTVRVWTARGEPAHRIEGDGPVYRLLFTDEGQLATCDSLGKVRLWDLPSGAVLREFSGHTGRVYALCSRGSLLVSGDTDGGVRLWDLSGRNPSRSLTGHTGAIYNALLDPSGELLATSDSDGAIFLWDVAGAEGVWPASFGRRARVLSGHRGAVWPPVFRPDGGQLATVSNDGTARLWDTATGAGRHTLRGHGRRITTVTFSPDGSTLATAGNDGVVRLWDPATGAPAGTPLTGEADRLTSVVFSPDGQRLGTATNDGGVQLRQAATGAFERELSVGTDHVWAQAFSPSGDILATANDDDTVRLWYHTTGREVGNLDAHRGRVRCIDFSPDGARVATGCDDRLVRIWDTATGALLHTLEGHGDRVYQVVFDPSGALLASASNDGTARLWNAATGATLRSLGGHAGRLWTVAFSPDGGTLATAGDDLVIRLWDAATGEPIAALTGHTRRVWSVAFSPDGDLLASGGDDGTVILWTVPPDPSRAALRCTLLGLAEGWAMVAPDGRYKHEGAVTGQFWWSAGLCRFEPGEMDEHLPSVRRLPVEEPL